MISWMQKNNKFLIITIWIATISFIFTGATAGFSFGIKSNSIGKVGDIELKRDIFSMEYNNLFNRYNQMMQGKFDRDQAKRMGLEQQVLNNMATQAKILNLAKEFGIIVTEEEAGRKIIEIPAFHTNGVFDRKVYDTFIQNSQFQQSTFEESFKNQLIIEKTLKLLNVKGINLEYDAFKIAFEVADKFKYSILSKKDVNVTIDEVKLKEFWEKRKEEYKTTKEYTLDILWTDVKDINVTQQEISDFYAQNKLNYRGKDGKILPLDDVKGFLIDDLKVKLAHKPAYKDYLLFKKGEVSKTETLTLKLNDPRLPKELWNEIKKDKIDSFIKPKAIKKRYASIKLVSIIEPKIKEFQEVKEDIKPLYKEELNREALSLLAEKRLLTIDNNNTSVSNFITLNNATTQKIGLNKQETVSFVSKLFTSQEEKGMIPIGSKIVIYKIVEQKLITLENNNTEELYRNTDKVKEQSLQMSLIKRLDKMYPTQFYK